MVMSSYMDQESVIIDELIAAIYERTGITVATLDQIDCTQGQTAGSILSVLVEWCDRVSNPSYRHALYACFHTRFAHPFIGKLLEWWESERDFLCLSSLTQTLALVAKADDASAIWAASNRSMKISVRC